MPALNSAVASVPARGCVFVLTDWGRAWTRGEGSGEADSKLLVAYARDVLNENCKLLLGFAKDNQLAFLNTFFTPFKVAGSTRFKVLTAARHKRVWTMS